MTDPKGFLKLHRVSEPQRDPAERTKDYGEIFQVLKRDELQDQASRCMNCGIPFCHHGCPLGNLIPEWNDLVSQDRWREAIDRLHATNNFPEFTGLICPAPCEPACVLEINDDPVMIKQLELGIVERAFEEGWITPNPPPERTGRTVAVVGSGPAGMAVAAQLNRAGHSIVVFERDEGVGGLMRFGVPDHKLEKWYIDRRVGILEQEGIEFRCGVEVGSEVSCESLRRDYDAVVLTIGSRVQRDLDVPGRDLGGVCFAMDYLYQRNRYVASSEGRPALATGEDPITAAGKHVIVIGGGDTGADCISNAHRERAASVTQLDTYPAPHGSRPREITSWPEYPKRLPSNYALDEGGTRRFSTLVTHLEGDHGSVNRVCGCEVTPPPNYEIIPGSQFAQPADLVLIAVGFLHPDQDGVIGELDLARDARGNIKASTYSSSREGVFAAGDARIGQSLIVTAIAEGRRCARVVDRYLGGSGIEALGVEKSAVGD
jgi:glutamate synthase (NADPH) small chain